MLKIVIIVEPVAGRPSYFAAALDGVKLCISREPLLAAARELQRRGWPPDTILAMRHAGSDHDALRGRLGALAMSTIADNRSPCACGETTVTIGPGTEPHAASLYCASCDRHRGWLQRTIAEFLLDVVRRFGRPADAVAIRNSTEFAQANEAAHPVQAQQLPFLHHEPKRN